MRQPHLVRSTRSPSAHFLFDNGHPPRFLAKESLFRAPVVGRIVRGAEQIPVYRESAGAAMARCAAAVAAVEAGECVAIYPEGTLTRDPDLWPMRGKTGAARVALATGCPVIPVAQWGAQEILAPYKQLAAPAAARTTSQSCAGPPVDLCRFDGPRARPRRCCARRPTRSWTRSPSCSRGIRGEQPPPTRCDPRDRRAAAPRQPERGATGRGRHGVRAVGMGTGSWGTTFAVGARRRRGAR